MNTERPDLSDVSDEVRRYIQFLENEVERLGQRRSTRSTKRADPVVDTPPLEPDEPPTTINIITLSASGLVKRTPRHLYSRQRRSGMGIFDMDVLENDPPVALLAADENQHLIMVTNQARAFRFPVNFIESAAVRDKGQPLTERFPLRSTEQFVFAVPDLGDGYLIMVTERGHVRRLRHHYFGNRLRPGTNLYNLQDLGAPTAACWSSGDKELFITTQKGKGIRFAERLVPANGCLGIRLGKGDRAIAVTIVQQDSRVFMLSNDGKGTIRLMSGFQPNKAPGSGGKVAMKTDNLVGTFTAQDEDDVFAISRLSKIIRFRTIEVPPKEGTVQGVNCMSLRADTAMAITNGTVMTL